MATRIVPNGDDERQDGSQKYNREWLDKLQKLFDSQQPEMASYLIFDLWFETEIMPPMPPKSPNKYLSVRDVMRLAWLEHRKEVVSYMTEAMKQVESEEVKKIIGEVLRYMP